MAGDHAWAVILLGIASTTQIHLAKALERQGIDVLDLIKAKLRRTPEPAGGGGKTPWIYLLGLGLNHTTFLYHLFVAPLGGTTALYTSMYGMGLVALLFYSSRVMKERLARLELAGAVAILLGTLTIGLEGISRPPTDMAQMNLASTATALVVLLALCLIVIVAGLRNGSPKAIGLAFGLSAGVCGTLDPFLKTVGQTAGGGGRFLPGVTAGWLLLAFSFLVGEMAFLITQWGFYRRARANVLVPALNCSYIGVPVLLQALLLPGYNLYWSTFLGLALIMAGFVLVRGLSPKVQPAASPQVGEQPVAAEPSSPEAESSGA